MWTKCTVFIALCIIYIVSAANHPSSYIATVHDQHLSIIRDDGKNVQLYSRSLSSQSNEWETTKLISRPPHSVQFRIPDTNLLLIGDFLSNVHLYDLTMYQFMDSHYISDTEHLKNSICLTFNPTERILYSIGRDALFSFNFVTNTWNQQSIMTLDGVHVGCALDRSYSNIYLFGATLQKETVQSQNAIIKYTMINDEWSAVDNVDLNVGNNPIRCMLLPSDGNIRCITKDILFSFDPAQDALVKDVAEKGAMYLSIALRHNSCLLVIKGSVSIIDPLDDIAIQNIGDCPGNEFQAAAIPQNLLTMHHHRHLLSWDSWPTVTLNATYTENVTLKGGNVYVVNGTVTFSATLIVEDNATILFTADHRLKTQGDFFMGTCSDDGTRGASANAVHVYHPDNTTYAGAIWIQSGGHYPFICNTKLYNMGTGFLIGNPDNLKFDNLEFHNCQKSIIFWYSSHQNGYYTITDSIFISTWSIDVREDGWGTFFFQNNVFQVQYPIYFTYKAWSKALDVFNNTFVGPGSGSAITGVRQITQGCNVINNTFSDFNYAIDKIVVGTFRNNLFRNNNYAIYGCCGSSGKIQFNQFLNNNYAIWMYTDGCNGAADIEYNTFINHEIAILFPQGITLVHVNYNNFINETAIFSVTFWQQHYCGYNYYGINTSNPYDIQAFIHDACDGTVDRYYTMWWPWYNEPIDLNSLPVQLAEHTVDEHVYYADCVGRNNHPEPMNGTKLAPVYLHDMILTASNSPYYVVQHTRINYNLIIEPSVEVIFVGGYEVEPCMLGGGVYIGQSMCNQTQQYHGVGLYDADTAIYIHGPGKIEIQQYTTNDTFICNTKFMLTHGFYLYHSYSPLTLIDNCEFINCQYGAWIRAPRGDLVQITDSLFHDGDRGIYSQTPYVAMLRIYNNIFNNIRVRAIEGQSAAQRTLSIVNNTFDNENTSSDGMGVAGLVGVVNITNNTFKNFEIALQNYYGSGATTTSMHTGNIFMNNDIAFDFNPNLASPGTHVLHYNEWINNNIAIQASYKNTGYLDIKYNNFVHNNVSIVFLNESPKLVKYNNFDDNEVNFEMKSAVDADDCSQNWNGEVSDITDPVLIQSKILDICTPNGYDAKIKFWPYFDGPLFFDDISNLPALYTIDYINCSTIEEAAAYFMSDQPTRSPTSLAPTYQPTDEPTTDPSAAPTSPPTNAPSTSPTVPTLDPTKQPTSDPTNEPTYEPTLDPTTDPTFEPTTDPTHDPTFIPTVNPTNYPTIDPTYDPTVEPTTDPTRDPTITPTTDPTVDPTSNPTGEPTKDPTREPTDDPTNDPTADPTIEPTTNPTTNPTKDPTQDPTVDPTFHPTRGPTTVPTQFPTKSPTEDPTSSPTFSPSSSPTLSPHSFAELLTDNADRDESSTTNDMFIVGGIASIAIIVFLLAFIMKRNDDQNFEAIALYMLQSFDLYSDIILAFVLYDYYSYTMVEAALFEDHERNFLSIICFVCVFSVIIPYLLNIFTSIRIISKISREKHIPSFTKDFFDSHNAIYALGTLLNGGCYTTLALLNCKLFNLPIFNSGLSRYKLRQFEHFKIINTVLLENIPQITVQGLALYTFGDQVSEVFGATIWASFITSLLSILLSLMVWFLRRTRNNDYFRISLHVSIVDVSGGGDIRQMFHIINGIHVVSALSNTGATPANDEYEAAKYFVILLENSKYRKKLGKRIADYLAIAQSNIEILSAFKQKNGLKINAIFSCNKHERREADAVEESMKRMDFIHLLQNVYDVNNAYLNIRVKIYKVDDTEPKRLNVDDNNNSNVTSGELPAKHAHDDALSLLTEWGLSQYWGLFQQHGYENVKEWEYLVSNTEKLEAWGVKEGHAMAFKREYKERFVNVADGECHVELQESKVSEEGDGAMDQKQTAYRANNNKMEKIKTFSNDSSAVADADGALPGTIPFDQTQGRNEDNNGDESVDELVQLALEFAESDEDSAKVQDLDNIH